MYGLMNLNYLVEQSRQSPRWARGEQSAVGESDPAFAQYVARHLGGPIRKTERGAVVFFREVLGIDDVAGPELGRVA